MAKHLGGLGPATITITWTMVAISMIFTAARLYTRRFLVKKMGMDDLFAAISIIFFIIYACFSTEACLNGMGRRGSSFTIFEFPIFARASLFNNLCLIFMGYVSWTTKSIVIFFLLRLVAKRWQRILLWLLFASTATVGILYTVFVLLQCFPFRKTWDPFSRGTCYINIKTYGIFGSVYGPILDLVLAALPWLFIWTLKMPRKDRLLISLGLSLGIFACISGLIRLYYVTTVKGLDQLFTLAQAHIASTMEIGLTIICATIPALRPLYTKLKGYKMSSLWYEMKYSSKSSKVASIGQPSDPASESQTRVNYRPSRDIETGYSIYTTTERTLWYDDETKSLEYHNSLVLPHASSPLEPTTRWDSTTSRVPNSLMYPSPIHSV